MSFDSSTRTTLNAIGSQPLLTPQEEIHLWRQIENARELQESDRRLTAKELRIIRRAERAKERFVSGNLRLVVYIAKKYLHGRNLQHMDLLDLIQEGSIGLMKAVERFDASRGYKFSTYAYWWVKQAIGRAIDQKERTIRRPNTACVIATRANRAISKLTLALGRFPTTAEVAKELGISMAEMELFLERGSAILSLDMVLERESDTSWIEMIADPSTAYDEDRHEQIEHELRSPVVRSCFNQLTEQEQVYICMRYGLPPYDVTHGLLEIGATAVGDRPPVSKERARQIINCGLNKLRLHLAKQGLSSDSQLPTTPSEDTKACQRGPVEALRSRRALHALPALQSAA